jgi:hypothetical protein
MPKIEYTEELRRLYQREMLEERREQAKPRRGTCDPMSGRRSRDKGARAERAIAKLIGAQKVSRAYQAGHDLELKVGDRLLRIECKARSDGFRELYAWLEERDVLIVKADRQTPLVVARLPLAVDLVNGADQAGNVTSSAAISSMAMLSQISSCGI